jgi:hypothetical protein
VTDEQHFFATAAIEPTDKMITALKFCGLLDPFGIQAEAI